MDSDKFRLLTRLHAHILDAGDDCWLWTGSIHRTGYGHVKVQGRTVSAHVAMYECMVGPVSKGLVLDHTCHDPKVCVGGWSCIHRRCLNPAHLEPVTQAENQRRGGNGNHFGLCRNGLHAWTGERAECLECERARKRKSGGRRVVCPTCGREGSARHQARHAASHRLS